MFCLFVAAVNGNTTMQIKLCHVLLSLVAVPTIAQAQVHETYSNVLLTVEPSPRAHASIKPIKIPVIPSSYINDADHTIPNKAGEKSKSHSYSGLFGTNWTQLDPLGISQSVTDVLPSSAEGATTSGTGPVSQSPYETISRISENSFKQLFLEKASFIPDPNRLLSAEDPDSLHHFAGGGVNVENNDPVVSYSAAISQIGKSLSIDFSQEFSKLFR